LPPFAWSDEQHKQDNQQQGRPSFRVRKARHTSPVYTGQNRDSEVCHIMNGRIIVYARTKPPVVLDHVTKIELGKDIIIVYQPSGSVEFEADDILQFELANE